MMAESIGTAMKALLLGRRMEGERRDGKEEEIGILPPR
jgi:hypothetical protein